MYVNCDETPAALPQDAVATLCRIAAAEDWKSALRTLDEVLKQGQPRAVAADVAALPAPDTSQQVGHTVSGADEAKDADDAFYEVAKNFRAAGYIVGVEACPRIKTEGGGSWHSGVVITWTPE